MSFAKSFVYYHPTDANGGSNGSSGGDLTDPGASATSDAGSGEGQSGDVEDDYSDLAGDERVTAYIAKQYGHIPEEHRSPEGFKALLGHRDQAASLHQQLQALQQQRQAPQQQQQAAAEKAFHEDILAGLEKIRGTPLNPEQRRFFGGMIDAIHKAMDGHFKKSYFDPIASHLQQRALHEERTRANALPGYKENEREIMNIVRQSNGSIPFDAAYKIVMYDKGQKTPAKANGAGGSTVASGNGAASGTSGNGSKRPVSDGDRPSGASASGGKIPKYKDADAARRGAESVLESRGIRVRSRG